jgi:predicted HTH domain antitoxin
MVGLSISSDSKRLVILSDWWPTATIKIASWNMPSATLEIGEELTALLEKLGKPVEQAAREMIVFELYRRSLISSGKAAALLGTDRLDFVGRASDLGIPYFRFSEDEWRAEIAESKRI